MSGIDHSLIYQARKFMTGENVHQVKTWIFCYETSEPGSVRSRCYETLLREFVASHTLLSTAKMKEESECARLMGGRKRRREPRRPES